MQLEAIQKALGESGLDGWLFYDFRGTDPLAAGILGLDRERFLSRRWFYFIPTSGEPTKIVHAIEPAALDMLPGKKRVYLPWEQLRRELADSLAGAHQVAMQYSPKNAIPYVSKVDAGTIELVRSLGVEVISSAELVQRFEAVIDAEQEKMHMEAADKLGHLVMQAFEETARRLRDGVKVCEYDVQQFIWSGFEKVGMIADHPPIVGINAHAADPHFAPAKVGSTVIEPNQLLLIDAWAKLNKPRSIYADITWMGYTGRSVPDEQRRVFEIVRDARDAAVSAVTDAQKAGRTIRGCDVDDACRAVIADAGYGQYFIHRTGHSIHETDHGNGTNIDNLETHDERALIPRTCFSIEPGIYFPDRFGVRSEINVFLPDARSVVISGLAPQRELIAVV